MLFRVTLAIDDAELRRRIRRLLPRDDVVVEIPRGRKHLWQRALRTSCDVIIAAETAIPPPVEDSVDLVKQLPESPSVVVISEARGPEAHARLLAAGSDVALYAGVSDEILGEAMQAVLRRRDRLGRRGPITRRAVAEPRLSDFVSDSPTMQAFMQVVHRVVKTDTSLLILGETGTGKERLARAIHAEGPRAGGPFIAVNCGALPESLLESELFGHEEGAFTGATRSRRGCFELAHDGTIFLDEVGEMPNHLQVKLLRVLQEHEFQRVGAEKAFAVNVRVIAASNRDLEEEVQARQFRKDLYYRLSVVCLTVPPLRERVEDIPALVESYLQYFRPRIGCEVHGITPDALEALRAYSWPGNVRELINVVERGMLLSGSGEITLNDLPAVIRGSAQELRQAGGAAAPYVGDAQALEQWLTKPLKEVKGAVVENLERAYLAALLRATGGRIGETAKRAGIEPRSVYAKMKRYGLRKEDFRRRALRE